MEITWHNIQIIISPLQKLLSLWIPQDYPTCTICGYNRISIVTKKYLCAGMLGWSVFKDGGDLPTVVLSHN